MKIWAEWDRLLEVQTDVDMGLFPICPNALVSNVLERLLPGSGMLPVHDGGNLVPEVKKLPPKVRVKKRHDGVNRGLDRVPHPGSGRPEEF